MALRISGKYNTNLSDQELLEMYQSSGNLDVLGVLYERYMQLVYGVCLKYLKNRDESQDAVMAIFEKLIIELEKHKVDNFKSWLYVLTRNYCLMELRAGKSESDKIRRLQEEGGSFMENGMEMHPIDSEGQLSDRALEECIKKLKEEQESCIRLFYYENKCYREIAEVLKLDEKKIKSHLQNAKRNLKICLESSDE